MSSIAKQKDDGLNEVRAMLKIWADWLRTDNRSMARGYPQSSAFIHADEVRQTCDQVSNDNPVALQVETAMCKLKKKNHNAFLSLVYDYLLELSNREAAERMKCSERTYKYWRSQGEHFILGSVL